MRLFNRLLRIYRAIIPRRLSDCDVVRAGDLTSNQSIGEWHPVWEASVVTGLTVAEVRRRFPDHHFMFLRYGVD